MEFTIRPVPPFRLDFTVWALRRRPRNLVDRWDGDTFRRVVVANKRAVEVAVRQTGTPTAPLLNVTVTSRRGSDTDKWQLRRLLDRLLGLRVDLSPWYHTADRDPQMRQLADRFRGVKPPRFATIFETLVNAVACQQLSLEAGITILNRLATARGTSLEMPAHVGFAFPSPEQISRMPPTELQGVGFSRQKAGALLDLADAIVGQQLSLESLAREPNNVIAQRLLQLRGVGRWTTEYALLRGFGRLQTFPGDDVGAQKNLARWLGRARPLDYAGVARVVARWRPYAGLVYFHLLLDGLSRAGALERDDPQAEPGLGPR